MVDVVVEQERVRAADEVYVVAVHEVEERLLADVEAPFGVRGEASVEARWGVHEHDPVRLGG
jgi:hypothetical protein